MGTMLKKSFSENVLKTNGWNLHITCLKSCNLLWNGLTNFHQISHQRDIVQMVSNHGTRWLPCPYMLKKKKKKNILKYLLQNQENFWDWILVYSTGDSRSSKFVQMMKLGWPLTFCDIVKFASPCKIWKKQFLKMYKKLMAEVYNVCLM